MVPLPAIRPLFVNVPAPKIRPVPLTTSRAPTALVKVFELLEETRCDQLRTSIVGHK